MRVPTKVQMEAVIDAIRAVGEAIRDLDELRDGAGVPSGELYAHLMGMNVSMENYQIMVEVLKKGGLIAEENHLLKWVGPKKEDK